MIILKKLNPNNILLLSGVLVLCCIVGVAFLDIIYIKYIITILSVAILITWGIVYNNMNKSLSVLLHKTTEMVNGKEGNNYFDVKNEIYNSISTNLNKIQNRIQEAVDVVGKLGIEKNLTYKYLNKDEILGKSLLITHEKISAFNEEEGKRRWKVEGIAKFAKILRSDASDVNNYCFKIISELAKYVSANQGGLYLEYENEEEGSYLELMGTYAYSRKKYNEKKVFKGQGLLGQCVLEKETLFLTQIPDNYVNITSGLGEVTPNNIIIVPLIFNDVFYGAFELATFKKFEHYKVEFLESIAESIAGSISNIKTNETTNLLLKESQTMATELRSSEDEMRQNMEKLSAIQEDMQRNQVQLKGLFNAIDTTLAMAEIDVDGNIIKINDQLADVCQLQKNNIVGTSVKSLIDDNTSFQEFWSQINNKETIAGENKIKTDSGKSIWLDSTFTPVINSNGELEKVLMLSKEITSEKELEIENENRNAELQSHMNAINKTVASCEYDMEGYLIKANDIFLLIGGYQLEDIVGKHYLELLPKEEIDKPQTTLMWEEIKEGKFFEGEFKLLSKNGDKLWLKGTYNPIHYSNGDPYKVIMFAQFVTDEKEKRADLNGVANALRSTLPVLELKPDRTFRNANTLFFNQFKCLRKDLRGKTLEEMLTKESRNKVEEIFEEMNDKKFAEENLTFRCADGTDATFHTSFTPIFDLGNNISKIVLVMVKVYFKR